MRRPRAWHGVVIAAGAMVILAAGAIAFGRWMESSPGSPATATTAVQAGATRVPAVKAAFTEAIAADRALGTPSAAYMHAAANATKASAKSYVVPAAEQSELQASGTAQIARYFSGKQAAIEREHLADALKLDSNPLIINLGSGVSKVKFLSVSVAGSQATVEADVTVWAKSKARQTSSGPWLTADPVNKVDETAILRLSSSDTWQVASLTGSFVPGYGP